MATEIDPCNAGGQIPGVQLAQRWHIAGLSPETLGQYYNRVA